VIAITDSDDAGRKLGNIAHESFEVPEGHKDLGEMTQDEVNGFLESIGQMPKKRGVEVHPIGKEEVMPWIEKHHYLNKWPTAVQSPNGDPTKHAMGVFHEGQLVGTVVYGISARPQSTREIFQDDQGNPIMQNNQMWELQRLFLDPEAQKTIPNLASQAIARSNEYVRQNGKTKDGLPVKAIISYADSSVGHEGTVYKATNALYLGEWDATPQYVIRDKAGKVVAKQGKISAANREALKQKGFTLTREKPESGKHKYVYPLGKDQKERDALTSHIAMQLYSYPSDGKPGEPIPNPVQKKAQPQHQGRPKAKVPTDRNSFLQDIMNRKVNNPVTGNKILVKTALGYGKEHPAYQQASGMLKGLAQRAGITL